MLDVRGSLPLLSSFLELDAHRLSVGLFPIGHLPHFCLPCVSCPRHCDASLGPPTAQGIATGKYHAAVLTNNAEWEAACVKAGRQCGDLVHPLVYCPELHFSEFTSAVADMKNSVAVGGGFMRGPGWRPSVWMWPLEADQGADVSGRRTLGR